MNIIENKMDPQYIYKYLYKWDALFRIFETNIEKLVQCNVQYKCISLASITFLYILKFSLFYFFVWFMTLSSGGWCARLYVALAQRNIIDTKNLPERARKNTINHDRTFWFLDNGLHFFTKYFTTILKFKSLK